MKRDDAVRRYVSQFLVLSAIYFIGATPWGQNATHIAQPITLLWPASGIALAFLFLWGWRLFPAIALASFGAHIVSGAALPVAVGLAAANTLEALAGVWLLARYVRLDPFFSRLRDAVGFVTVAVLAPIIAATLGAMALSLGSVVPAVQLPKIWSIWWIGDTFAILIIAPLLIRWIAKPFFRRTPAQIFEGALMFVALGAASSVAFLSETVPLNIQFPMLFIFIPILWIVLRTDPRFVTLAIFVTASVIHYGTLSGLGVFAPNPLPDRFLLAQLFAGMVSIIFLIFSSALEERKEAQIKLSANVGELETALQKIRASDRAKNEFIAVLAHELRNPLAPILNTLDLFTLKQPHQSEIPQLVATMRENVQTMKRLLDDLLDIARLSRKGYALKKGPTDIVAVARRAIENARHLIDERSHTLDATIAPEPLWMQADPVRIEQIMVNLINNAARYTKRGGHIVFSCRAVGKEIILKVRDSGVGISQKSLEHIFEPFWQEQHFETESAGLGIGLALVKKLVEFHRGRIAVKSEVGRGSEFTVYLPMLHAAPLPLPAAEPREREMRGTMRIMVVDDNKAAAESLQKLLEALGHRVSIGFGGADALELIERSNPQVLFLDIGLPDMDGYEVARRLRQRGRQLYLVALTGYGQDEDRKKAKAAGFDSHIVKPVGVADLKRAIAAAAPA